MSVLVGEVRVARTPVILENDLDGGTIDGMFERRYLGGKLCELPRLGG